MDKKLEKYAAIKENCQASWKQLTQRHSNLANRPGDIRSPFARDYTLYRERRSVKQII